MSTRTGRRNVSRILRSMALSVAMGLPLLSFGGEPANTVYNFLRNDVGARPAALGGSVVSVTDDADLLFYNPASLATLTAPRGSAGFFKHLMDINSGNVAFGTDLEDIGHIGIGVLYTNYGSFTETDAAGNPLGTFSASDLALSAGYATSLSEGLSVGGALKFIYSSLAGYSSTGLALDGGILYQIPDTRAAVGASVRNLGTQLSTYAGASEALPLDVTIGGSVVPRGLPLLLNLNFHRLNDPAESIGDMFQKFTIGGEFTLSKVLQLRFGYDNARRQDLKIGSGAGLAGFAVGLGIHAGEYSIDYALSSLGKVGNYHRISVASSF